jgi:hypothetical protein
VRTIKTLGIATAMALALIAFGASSASASKFINVSGGETTVSGSRSGANHVLTLGGESFKCSNVSLSGGKWNGLEPSDLLLAPELGGCSWQPGAEWTWNMNGCKLRLRPGLENEAQSTIGWVDIVGCEKAMSISSSSPFCEVTIGNQNGIGTMQYKNTGTGSQQSIQLIANLSGIEYTRSAYGCSSSNGTLSTFTNGAYAGEWTLKGSTTNGLTQKPIKVEPTKSAKSFFAEEAPVTIAGKIAENKAFLEIAGNGGVTCSEHQLSGTSASATIASITVTPFYSGSCTFLGQKATVNMGGCSYVLHVNGEFDIAGSTCASNPIVISAGSCTATIGPKSGLSGLTYSNAGSAKLRSVTTGGEAKGITSTTTGVGCITQGTFNSSVYKGKDTFTATNSGGKQQGLWVE